MITPSQRIAAAFTRVPIKYTDEHAIYLIVFEDGSYYSAAAPPAIYDDVGRPAVFAAELGAGTLVRLHLEGRTMLAIQVLELQITNPFSNAA